MKMEIANIKRFMSQHGFAKHGIIREANSSCSLSHNVAFSGSVSVSKQRCTTLSADPLMINYKDTVDVTEKFTVYNNPYDYCAEHDTNFALNQECRDMTTSTNDQMNHTSLPLGKSPQEQLCRSTNVGYKVCNQRINRGENIAADDVTKSDFNQSDSLVRNNASEIGHKYFQCTVCQETFQSAASRAYHQSIHRREKTFQCDICSKHLLHAHHLIQHKRIHTGETFQCDVCGNDFSYFFSLTQHKLIHMGEKPFHCDICGKGFTLRQDMTFHKRVHTGEKPYQCDICGKSFTQHHCLTAHKRVHTGEKPYACDICGKRFTQNQSLTAHKRVHTGEKPFQCDICLKHFSNSSHLTQHNESTQERNLISVICVGKVSARSLH